MKILLTTGIYPPDIGGPATYVRALTKHLPRHGYQVKVVTYADTSGHDEDGAVQIYKISRQQNIFSRYLKYFLQVWRLLTWADVVYAQGPVSEGLPTWLACALRRKKFILKIVGDYAWEQARQRFGVKDLLDDFQAKKYSWSVELMRICQKKVARAAGQIIVPSYYLKDIVKGWVEFEHKIKVIYNAVEQPKIAIDKAQAKAQLGLAGKIIISVGRLVPWKGFDALISLMPELLKEDFGFRLIIVGQGPQKQLLEEKVKQLNLEPSVKILPKMPAQKLWLYMRAADYFILNSSYEGLPHIVIEAMALGLPVIVSNIGGNREVVEHKRTGWLVKLNDKQQIKQAILSLDSDPALAVRLSRAAQTKAREFSYQAMIKELIKIFNQNQIRH